MKDDQAAEEFTAFVIATGTQLERSALLLTGDAHLAQDLCQTTYTKVFLAWRRIRDNPFGYARATLLNTFISHRRLRRSSERPTASMPEGSATASDTTERLDVLDALGTLPAIDRAVLVLRFWEDRSVADTAYDLGLTEAAVRTRTHRALQRLRPLLDLSELDLNERTAP